MAYKFMFTLCAAGGLLASSCAFAAVTDRDHVAHRVVHKHYTAHYRKPGVVSDVPQETMAPEVQPEKVPEYFGHAQGSDGSM